MQSNDVISAIATADGAGGIGIVRLSGQGAIDVAAKVFRPASGRSITDMAAYQAAYGHVIGDDGDIIDEAICLVMRGPHSYTTEDVAELQCHGGREALRQVLAQTYRAGARPAQRGEFTKRAFLGGRLDLSQALGVMEMVKAPTPAALRMASGHLAGNLSKKLKQVGDQLLGLIAHLEAAIDFPEDDIEEAKTDYVYDKILSVKSYLEELLKTARTGRILREGLPTVIIGKPNVGKSSLLNTLLGEERAIVTDTPGTTRDSIEEYANIGGVPLRLIDTAGIRDTSDDVERIGTRRARELAAGASLILAMFDSSRPLTAEDEEILTLLHNHEAIIILNKTDLSPEFDKNRIEAKFSDLPLIELSLKKRVGLDKLQAAIVKSVYQDNKLDESTFIQDEGQADLLRRAIAHLEAAAESTAQDIGEDFVSIDLRSAWELLGEITGETASDTLIDQIFSRFCIGK